MIARQQFAYIVAKLDGNLWPRFAFLSVVNAANRFARPDEQTWDDEVDDKSGKQL